MSEFKLQCVQVGSIDTNCYLISGGTADTCLVVDPGDDAEKILAAAAPCRPAAVLLTHGHYDHIRAVEALCTTLDIPVYVHREDMPFLADPEKNGSFTFGECVICPVAPLPLEEGELELAGIPLRILHTPGHTPGGVSIVLPDGLGVLTGDTLFAHGYGRTDLYGGDFHTLRGSLRRLLMELPRMTAWPGHEGPGTAGKAVPLGGK